VAPAGRFAILYDTAHPQVAFLRGTPAFTVTNPALPDAPLENGPVEATPAEVARPTLSVFSGDEEHSRPRRPDTVSP
jgi:hypothetical protein